MKGARGFWTTWLSSMFSSTITKMWSKAGAEAAGGVAGADSPASSDVESRTKPNARMRRTLERFALQLAQLGNGRPAHLDPDDRGQDAQDEPERGGSPEVQEGLGAHHAGQRVGGVEDGDGDRRFSLLGEGRRQPVVDRLDEDAANLFEGALAAGGIGVVVGDLQHRGGGLGGDLQVVDDHRG